MFFGNPYKFPCLLICPAAIFPTLFREKNFFLTRKIFLNLDSSEVLATPPATLCN